MGGEQELMADMGKYVIGQSPEILVSLGLGSCVGVAIWDHEKKIGGLAHIMLPKSDCCTNKENKEFNMNKFADCAIPNMVEELKKRGCNPARLKAKIAGGAHMFASLPKTEAMDIGKRNSESVKEELDKLSIQIVVNQTGGTLGRTIKFSLETEKLTIKTKDGITEF